RLRRRGPGGRGADPARRDPGRRRPRRPRRRSVRRGGGGRLRDPRRRGPRPARRRRGGLTMALDLTPSPRAHGAQRMFSATILVLEAFVVFFAVLVAHQLVPGDRALTWAWGLATALALVACSGVLRRGAWPYWLGLALQLPVILLGIQVPAMWV